MHTSTLETGANMSTLNTGLILAVAAAVLAMIAWSVQRIIVRIDRIGEKLNGLGERVAVIETKQDAQVQVGRRTAQKVGVRLPPEPTTP